MKGAPRIVFVGDAGPTVGGGHVMRCLTLARALTEQGAVCAFVATPAVEAVLGLYAEPTLERLTVAGGTPDDLAVQAARAATAWRADLATIDHYGFGPDQEAHVGTAVRRVLAIDDLRRSHACDLVLDSNLGRTAADYPGVAALTGVEFALVRPSFAALRATTLRRRAGDPAVRRILVSLGLTDVGGVTARVVEALDPVRGEAALDVVIGGAAPSLRALRAMARAKRGMALHIDTRDMAGLTSAADLAIGAGGSSVWERCCLGLPSVILVLADNQRPNALALAGVGAAVVIEANDAGFEARLQAVVGALAASSDDRRGLSRSAAELCDGLGANRVADRVLALVASA